MITTVAQEHMAVATVSEDSFIQSATPFWGWHMTIPSYLDKRLCT